MKKLIRLGDMQSQLLKKILREQYDYYPKRVSQFNVMTEGDKHYLCVNGKLDTHYYGQLMYMLGMEMQKDIYKR